MKITRSAVIMRAVAVGPISAKPALNLNMFSCKPPAVSPLGQNCQVIMKELSIDHILNTP